MGENTSNSTAGAEPSERRMSSFTRGPSPIAVDHVNFLNSAAEERFILYSKGMPTECFTLVLGGQVDLLVGRDSFPSKLLSFNFIAEEALTSPFYVPEFSAIVRTAARVYRIPKEKYEKYVTFQSVAKNVGTRVRILSSNTTLQQQRGSPRAALTNSFQRKHRGHSSDRESPTGSPLTRGTSETAMANERDQLLSRGSAFADRQSERALPRQPTAPASATRGKGYGTFSQKSAH